MHPDGSNHWEKVLHKKQYSQDDDAAYSSYFLLKTPTALRVIFNDEAKVVGWLCAASDSADCFYVGTEVSQNRTRCGRLDNLHYYLSSYIDLSNYGEASSDLPSQPQPTAHCSDCIPNYDETGIDCGGEDCYPCGMQDQNSKPYSNPDIHPKVVTNCSLSLIQIRFWP